MLNGEKAYNLNKKTKYGGVSVSTVCELESISIPQTVAALKNGKFKIKC